MPVRGDGEVCVYGGEGVGDGESGGEGLAVGVSLVWLVNWRIPRRGAESAEVRRERF